MKSRRNHINGSWQALVLISQAKLTADLVELKSVSGDKKNRSREIEKLHRKQNKQGVYAYKVCAHK